MSCTCADQNHSAMIDELMAGKVDAVVSDSTLLVPRAYAEPGCRLSVLPQNMGTFTIGFAFREGFLHDHPGLINAVNNAIIGLSEDGTLAVRHSFPRRVSFSFKQVCSGCFQNAAWHMRTCQPFIV